MRGRRFFRKVFTRKPSGWYRWHVLGQSNEQVASGECRRLEGDGGAKRAARAAERTALARYECGERNLRAQPAQCRYRTGRCVD